MSLLAMIIIPGETVYDRIVVSPYPILCGSHMNCLRRRKRHLALSLVRCLFALHRRRHYHYHHHHHYYLSLHHHRCLGHCTQPLAHLLIQHSNLDARERKKKNKRDGRCRKYYMEDSSSEYFTAHSWSHLLRFLVSGVFGEIMFCSAIFKVNSRYLRMNPK